jgi:hypothetical protein
MGWQLDNGPEQAGTFVAAVQLRKSLHRPEVIKLLLTAGSVDRALELLNQRRRVARAGQRPRRRLRAQPPRSAPGPEPEPEKAIRAVQDVLPPVVLITRPDRTGARLAGPDLEVHAVARGQAGHPVTALRLLVDDRPYRGDEGRKAVAAAAAAGGDVREGWAVHLDPGRHRLAVVAESDVSNGRSDEVEVVYADDRAAPPRLYVLAVGVSKYPGPLRLQCAAADARALADLLRAKAAPLFEGVEVRVLLDEEATRRHFIENLGWLRQSVRDRDVGLVFFSGHGAYRDETFYMLPVDAEVADLDSTAVAAEQLKKILPTRGRLMVLLDACHSGAEALSLTPHGPAMRLTSSPAAIPIRRLEWTGMAPAGLVAQQPDGDTLLARQLVPVTDNLVRELSYEHGVITMSSSTAGEVSVESAELRHGYFTQALLEGLSGKADLNKDGLVYFNELDPYLCDRVQALAKGRQHPAVARPAGVLPFAVTRP